MAYKKNFLSQVIFQANYENVEALKNSIDESLIALCEQKTGAKKQEGKSAIVNFGLIIGGANKPTSMESNSIWNFVGKEIVISIQFSTILIQMLKYTDHVVFHEVINSVTNELKRIYSPRIARVSLRYVNNLSFPSGDTFDFSEFIVPALLEPTLAFKNEKLTRSMGVIAINDIQAEIMVNFSYGFFNSQFPGSIVKREYVLDYDCSHVSSEMEQIDVIIKKLRAKANSLFEKSILDPLKAKLNE